MYQHRGNSVPFLNFKTYPLSPCYSFPILSFPLLCKVSPACALTTSVALYNIYFFDRVCVSGKLLLRFYILTFELSLRQFIALTLLPSSRYLPFRNAPRQYCALHLHSSLLPIRSVSLSLHRSLNLLLVL